MKRSIYIIFILLAVFAGGAGASFAQTSGKSVMMYNRAKTGTEESAVGNAFEQALIRGLQEKYPCVDWMNEQVLKDALERLRQQELLTGELDQQALAELGNQVGADFIIVVRVYTMPNGQTVVSARVIDFKKGGATVADRIEQAASGDAAYEAARKAASEILADMATPFRGQCDARWTGTITYIEKTLINKNENRDLTVIEKVNAVHTEDFERRLEVALQPIAKGSKTNFFDNGNTSMTMSRVLRKYSSRVETHVTETGEEACRQRGANPVRKKYKSEDTKIIDEQGQNTETLPVEITIYTDTGRFRVRFPTPSLHVKKTEEHFGVRDFCVPQPFNEPKTSESDETSSYFDFDGTYDLSSPDTLAGKKVTGTLETRQYTIEWNLRRIDPNKKKNKPR
jgi:hypothetical protein